MVQFETRDEFTDDEPGMGIKRPFVDHRNTGRTHATIITPKARQFVLWTGGLSTFLLSTDAWCDVPSSWIN